MTQAAQIRQLRDLRQMKVDRLQAEAGVARKRVGAAKDDFVTRTLEFEKVMGGAAANFDSVIEDSADLADPQTRMVAITRTMARQRAAEVRAKTLRDEAELQISTAETRLERLMHDLAVAQGQLEAAERLAQRTDRVEALRAEERTDDMMQDQFSADSFGARAG